jgi:hypothetical protein
MLVNFVNEMPVGPVSECVLGGTVLIWQLQRLLAIQTFSMQYGVLYQIDFD